MLWNCFGFVNREDLLNEGRGGQEPPPQGEGGWTGLSQREAKIRPWPGWASEEEINKSNLVKN